MRVRSYLRRSHAREGGESINVQRQMIANSVQALGWSLDTVEYVDDDRSAFRDDLHNRPAMREALADARRKQFDVLAIYKWDRLARSEAIFHGLLADFRRLKVRVISATESDEPLTRSLSGLLAAEYSRVLSLRMTDVRRHEAQRGIVVGPVPLGYIRNANDILEPNEDASIVLELGELYAGGGWSAARLARRFGLHTDAVSEMLQCPTYAGFAACRDELFEGLHEAIWPRELWARIQSMRAERSRRSGRVVNDQPRLLSGLLLCANCGAPLWRHSRDRYRCSTLSTAQPGPVEGVGCTGGTTHAVIIEGGILAMLEGVASIPGLFADVDRAIAELVAEQPTRVRQTDQRALEKLKISFLREEISASEYERRRQILENQEPIVSTLAPDPRVARELIRNLPQLINAATNEELVPVVRELFTEVYARRREIVAVRPTILGAAILGPAGDHWLKVLEAGAGSPPGPPDPNARKRRFTHPVEGVFVPAGATRRNERRYRASWCNKKCVHDSDICDRNLSTFQCHENLASQWAML